VIDFQQTELRIVHVNVRTEVAGDDEALSAARLAGGLPDGERAQLVAPAGQSGQLVQARRRRPVRQQQGPPAGGDAERAGVDRDAEGGQWAGVVIANDIETVLLHAGHRWGARIAAFAVAGGCALFPLPLRRRTDPRVRGTAASAVDGTRAGGPASRRAPARRPGSARWRQGQPGAGRAGRHGNAILAAFAARGASWHRSC